MEEVKVSLFQHSANVRDENAIIGKIDVSSESVGYIPGRKSKNLKQHCILKK